MPLLAMPTMLSPGRTAAPVLTASRATTRPTAVAAKIESRIPVTAPLITSRISAISPPEMETRPRSRAPSREAGAEGFQHCGLRPLDADVVDQGDLAARRRR